MVWHIFKKDLRLTWGLAAGASIAHFAVVAGLFKLGHFGRSQIFGPPELLQLFHLLAFLCTGFLIIAVVHQDAIPGVRQDWLVRPIRKRDLLLAKFLFVLLVAQGPIFLAYLLEALADGFPFGQSWSAAISRSAYLLLSFSLPVLIFASLTRNFTQAIMGGLITLAGYAVFQVVWQSLNGEINFVIGPGNSTAIDWIAESFQLLLFVLGGAAVLRLQYWSRKTKMARWVTAGGAVLCLLMPHLPWQYAFALQKSVSERSPASGKISVAFEPGMGVSLAARGTGRTFGASVRQRP
jgi:hypothetical protein